ncbi:MAG: amidase, partial [Polymorphobacter sp.]
KLWGEKMDDFSKLDGLAQAALVASRQVTAAELLESAIARAEAVNPRLNFMAQKLYDRARKAPVAAGPFAGVPFLVKDLHVDIAGERAGEGSHLWDGYVPAVNSTLFDRYEAAGLVTFGKTTSPELGLTVTTESAAYGLTRNPWDPSRTSGGSSGGAAVAVAAGIVAMASASDGGGSIRAPASCCGVFGLKPSRGRMPSGPQRTEGWLGMSIAHAVTRSVRDSAALLDATHGIELGSRYAAPAPATSFLAATTLAPGKLRIAMMLSPPTGVPVDPEVIAATRATGKLLEDLGHHVEEAQPPLDGAGVAAAFVAVLGVCTAADVDGRAAARGRPIGDGEIEAVTSMFAHIGRKTSGSEIVAANDKFQQAAIIMAQFMTRYDVVLSPVLGKPPIKLGLIDLSPPEMDRWTAEITSFSPFTALYNQTGQPAMSVPLAASSTGLPIGMMFAGRYGAEALLFSLAAQLEAAAPWADKRPQLG